MRVKRFDDSRICFKGSGCLKLFEGVGGCWRVLDDSKKRNQIGYAELKVLKQVQDDIPFFRFEAV